MTVNSINSSIVENPPSGHHHQGRTYKSGPPRSQTPPPPRIPRNAATGQTAPISGKTKDLLEEARKLFEGENGREIIPSSLQQMSEGSLNPKHLYLCNDASLRVISYVVGTGNDQIKVFIKYQNKEVQFLNGGVSSQAHFVSVEFTGPVLSKLKADEMPDNAEALRYLQSLKQKNN